MSSAVCFWTLRVKGKSVLRWRKTASRVTVSTSPVCLVVRIDIGLLFLCWGRVEGFIRCSSDVFFVYLRFLSFTLLIWKPCEGGMWDLRVLVLDHCLLFTLRSELCSP